MYQIISHLDEPRRYFAMTVDEVCVMGLALLCMTVSLHKLMVMIISGLMLMSLRQLKQGKHPKYLWVLAYWHLPSRVTRWLLQLPASHLRVWQV